MKVNYNGCFNKVISTARVIKCEGYGPGHVVNLQGTVEGWSPTLYRQRVSNPN